MVSATSLFTIALLCVLAVFVWKAVEDFRTLQGREFRMQELSGVIRHLDEVLTMSALQGAATGDLSWETRYRRYEPLLDGAIKDAERLAPDAFGTAAARKTDEANAKLVAMEHRAFELVRQGHRDEAMSLLTGDAYRDAKQVYADGLLRITATLTARVATQAHTQWRRAVLAMVALAIGVVVTAVAWFVTLSTLRRYGREQERAERLQQAIYEISEAAQQSENLDQLFRRIHAIVGSLMAARNLYIAFWDQQKNLVSFPYFVDEEDQPEPPRPPKRGLTEYILRTGQPLLADPETFEELCRRGEVESVGAPSIDWLGVPLVLGERVLGALVVQSYTGDVRYGEREKGILTFVSRQVAVAIERKRSEAVLRESEERFRQVLQRAPVGVFQYDPDLTITDCNERFVEILQSSRERLIGLDMNRLKDGSVLPAIRAAVEGGLGEYDGPYRATTSSAHPFVSIRTAPLHGEGGTVVGGVGIVEDNTRHRNLEEQLLHSQKMEAVGKLAGGVAHDFNNLLQAMLTHAQLLRGAGGDASSVESATRELQQLIERGASLTRQLLVFSRRDTVKLERIDLNDAVRDSAQFLKRLVPANIGLELQLATGRLPVEADRGQLQQVLVNLTLNAADAMPEGGRLVIRTGGVTAQEVHLAVEDSGHGIEPEIRERIFEPFFTTKEVGKGTGLGLAVVHGIVTRLGGTIEVESVLEVGSTFTVVLPWSNAGIDEPFPEETPAGTPALEGGRNERLLVVEDETGTRESLRQVLGQLGYEVVAVGSAEEAIRLPDGLPFDLLLSDVMLPGIAGPQLAERLHERWPAMKVILMSGYAEDIAVRLGVRVGALRFLQKPFTMTELAQELRAALDEGEHTPGG